MARGTATTGYMQHTFINIAFLLLVRFALFLEYGLNYGWNWINVASIAFVLGTIWLNPDIDSNRSYTYRMWTPFFRWYWYPYTAIMRHSGSSYFPLEVRRGIGHNLFIGTAIRILYASPLFVGINELVKLNTNQWLTIIVGIWLSDALHITVDFMFHRNSRG